MRIGTAIDDYLDSLAAEGRAPGTLDAYRRDLGRLVAYLGPDFDVASTTPRHLLAFAHSPGLLLRPDGLPRHQGSINRVRTAVRGLFGFLVRSWVLGADPSQVLRVKATRPARPELLSAQDEARLLAAMEADGSWAARRDRLVLRVLLATGLRLSSLLALDLADLDVEQGRFHVQLKGGRRGVVALQPGLGRERQAWARGRPGPLFRSAQGQRLSARQVQLRRAGWVQTAGLGGTVTPHGLRHTFGTRRYRQTLALRRVQVALGHRSVLTTERYVGVG